MNVTILNLLGLAFFGSSIEGAVAQRQQFGPNPEGMAYPMSQFASGPINGGRLREFRPLGQDGMHTFRVGGNGGVIARLMTGADFAVGVDGAVEAGYRVYMDGWPGEGAGKFRQSGFTLDLATGDTVFGHGRNLHPGLMHATSLKEYRGVRYLMRCWTLEPGSGVGFYFNYFDMAWTVDTLRHQQKRWLHR